MNYAAMTETELIDRLAELAPEIQEIAQNLFALDISYMEGYSGVLIGIAELQIHYIQKEQNGLAG